MQKALTAKQQRLLDYLRERIAADNRPPSLREAAGDLGVSHSAVAQALRALEDKGYVKREGRYSRTLHILNRTTGEPSALHRWREVPVIGQIAAGRPLYAQEEWDGDVVLDAAVFRGRNLFALRIKGDSMIDAGILDGDIAICEPRQYAENGEIVVALIHGEEATVKRFYLREDHVELRPENRNFTPLKIAFSDILVQGRVIGIQRGPDQMKRV